ncbi:hypothetical protein GGE24_005029 [Bradyrhizobium centrosematis]|jgi:hypothetical protein|nr:hypothetical protein [Bradyrhizobium centrosematis]MCS3775690.1 hypothetical protein [Bradyrhizobium centrosematis]
MKMGAVRLTRNLQLGQGARPYQDVTTDFTSGRKLEIIRNKKASVQAARKPSFIVRTDQFAVPSVGRALNLWRSQFVALLASFRNSSISGWPMRPAASL